MPVILEMCEIQTQQLKVEYKHNCCQQQEFKILILRKN